jgi:hypothetical protein
MKNKEKFKEIRKKVDEHYEELPAEFRNRKNVKRAMVCDIDFIAAMLWMYEFKIPDLKAGHKLICENLFENFMGYEVFLRKHRLFGTVMVYFKKIFRRFDY